MLFRLAKRQSFRTQFAAASCETFLNLASLGDDAPRRIDVRPPNGFLRVSGSGVLGIVEGVVGSEEVAELFGFPDVFPADEILALSSIFVVTQPHPVNAHAGQFPEKLQAPTVPENVCMSGPEKVRGLGVGAGLLVGCDVLARLDKPLAVFERRADGRVPSGPDFNLVRRETIALPEIMSGNGEEPLAGLRQTQGRLKVAHGEIGPAPAGPLVTPEGHGKAAVGVAARVALHDALPEGIVKRDVKSFSVRVHEGGERRVAASHGPGEFQFLCPLKADL